MMEKQECLQHEPSYLYLCLPKAANIVKCCKEALGQSRVSWEDIHSVYTLPANLLTFPCPPQLNIQMHSHTTQCSRMKRSLLFWTDSPGNRLVSTMSHFPESGGSVLMWRRSLLILLFLLSSL